MSATSDRNAAIWFAPDAYDPAKSGINGRRVAGESFLRGFLQHADLDEIVAVIGSSADQNAMLALRDAHRPRVPLRTVSRFQPEKIAPAGTLFYSAPNYLEEVWRRASVGTAAYSLCGITHTTATTAVMQGFFDLRMAPHTEWDAVICTSQSVQTSVRWQLDLIDDHIRHRFGGHVPPRFQTPVIPLGVHCDDFTPDPTAGQALRKRMGAAERDVICTLTARLEPNTKFDPLPLYLALAAAQAQLGKKQKLHLALCGVFGDDVGRDVFFKGAQALMPDVGFLHLDGADAAARKAAMSAADIYLFPIDNVQETFGLAPIEGMAAGLPLIVSDWDGMKDTVSPDVGFRIPTRTLDAGHAVGEANLYRLKQDSYPQYLAKLAAMTVIDLPLLTARLVELARNPVLRRKMGAAGQARARALYDWRAVIPQMQDLFADLAARRRAGTAGNLRYPAHGLPNAPSPFALFRSYPTIQTRFGAEHYIPSDRTGLADLSEIWVLRGYPALRKTFQSLEDVSRAYAALQTAGTAGATVATLAETAGLPPVVAARVMMWLIKYDFARPKADTSP